jgi:hypothetical protein
MSHDVCRVGVYARGKGARRERGTQFREERLRDYFTESPLLLCTSCVCIPCPFMLSSFPLLHYPRLRNSDDGPLTIVCRKALGLIGRVARKGWQWHGVNNATAQ